MAKILLVIGLSKVRTDMSNMLRLQGHEVMTAEGEQSGRALASRDKPDLAIIDATEGNILLTIFKKEFPKLPCLCWIPERNPQVAVQLIKEGAIDCLCPPLRAADVLGVVDHFFGLSSGQNKGTILSIPVFNLWKYRKPLRVAAGVLAVAFLLLLFWPRDHTIRADLSYRNPTSITGDGTSLWISDWYTQSIYQYTYKDGIKLKKNYYFATYGPVAIATDGKFMWTCGNDLVLRKHVVSENMDLVGSYSLRDQTASGIVVLEDNLFIGDSVKKMIYHYSVTGYLSQITAYDCPVNDPVGLSFDGKYFWTADSKSDRIYVLEKTAGSMKVKNAYQLSQVPSSQIAGLYPEKKFVYVVYSGNPAKLIGYKINDLEEVKEVKHR
jgi:hypothetical protein